MKRFSNADIPIYILITSSSGGSTPAWQQENVSFPMMDMEINATMKEHDRQKEMRQKQTANATVETANQSQWKDFKDNYQSRTGYELYHLLFRQYQQESL
jgi:hypothetical protein